ncbi:MAG: hypothetical protein ABIR24_12870 [Verrucomicrobiota bacterium]
MKTFAVNQSGFSQSDFIRLFFPLMFTTNGNPFTLGRVVLNFQKNTTRLRKEQIELYDQK